MLHFVYIWYTCGKKAAPLVSPADSLIGNMSLVLKSLSTSFRNSLNRTIATSSLRNSDALPKQRKSDADAESLERVGESVSPLDVKDFFNVRNCFTLKELFDARVHLGHKEGTLNPNMKPYLVGSRLKNLIIDLEQTKRLLSDALNFTAHIASRRGIILIVNRSRQVCYLTLFITAHPHLEFLASNRFALQHHSDWSFGREIGSGSGRIRSNLRLADTRFPQLDQFFRCSNSTPRSGHFPQHKRQRFPGS